MATNPEQPAAPSGEQGEKTKKESKKETKKPGVVYPQVPDSVWPRTSTPPLSRHPQNPPCDPRLHCPGVHSSPEHQSSPPQQQQQEPSPTSPCEARLTAHEPAQPRNDAKRQTERIQHPIIQQQIPAVNTSPLVIPFFPPQKHPYLTSTVPAVSTGTPPHPNTPTECIPKTFQSSPPSQLEESAPDCWYTATCSTAHTFLCMVTHAPNGFVPGRTQNCLRHCPL
jgi:hypothetical protein